jgi:hypothetical protein
MSPNHLCRETAPAAAKLKYIANNRRDSIEAVLISLQLPLSNKLSGL